MPKKTSYDPASAFDDSNLPINPMSKERELEIDEKALPLLKETLKKLKEEKPHLFKSSSTLIDNG